MTEANSGAGSTGHLPSEPATHTLPVPGGTIAYDVSGIGPAVICVPSIGDIRAEYRFLRPQLLDAGFRVVTMDLRGHGESSIGFADYSAAATGSDILSLARQLDTGPVSIVGTSMAGGSTVWAASEAPDLIDRLVLISPFVRGHSGDALMKTVVNVLLYRPWGPSFWTMYFPNFYPSQKPGDFAAYRARLKANLRERGRVEALKAMLNSPNEMGVRLGSVRAPTLVVMGSRDPDFKDPAGEARWIAEHLRGKALVIEGAGHYPHAEMPDRVGPEIVQFLSGARQTRAA